LANSPTEIAIGSNIRKPDRLAIRRIQKWHSKAVPVAGAVERGSGITLRLFENVLRGYGDLFCFQNTEEFAIDE